MKYTQFLWLMLFLSMFVGYGCSLSDEMSEQAPVKKYPGSKFASTYNDKEDKTYDEIDVNEYIKRTPELFGKNILVFDSLEVIDDLLEQLEEMNYKELRQWCMENEIYTPNLHTKIIYDSIWNAKEDEFGIDFDTQDLDEDRLDLFYEVLESALLEYPDCCCEVMDEEYGICLNPRCSSIDEMVFCNDKNMFIADKVVFKYQDGFLLTCPINKYAEIGEWSDFHDLYRRLTIEEIAGNLEIGEGKICLAPLYPPQQTVEENLCSHIVKSGNYKLSVYITAYPYWSWGNTLVRGKAIVENYYKGKKYKQLVTGEIRFGAMLFCDGYTEYSPCQFFVKMEKLYGKYKSKTLCANWYRSGYLATKRTTAKPRLVEIDVTQHSAPELRIQYTHL